MRKHPLVRRAAKTAGALAIALGASLGSANAASADVGLGVRTCNYDGSSFNTCLKISSAGFGYFKVEVGIDVVMSQANAHRIINQPGQAFTALAIGSDPSSNDVLGSILQKTEGVYDSGIYAEFEITVPGSWLDEDWPPGDADEIYAQTKLTDRDFNSVRTFVTPKVVHEFG